MMLIARGDEYHQDFYVLSGPDPYLPGNAVPSSA